MLALILLSLTLWIWAVLDISRRQFKSRLTKAISLICVFMFPIIVPLLYFQLKEKLIIQKKRIFNKELKHC
ncbi:PLDc N-terminal domain-containing protein [Psychroflexus halocasei]